MPCIIGIDVGTTGTKAMLADDKGNVIAEAYKGYDVHFDRNGHAEQDAEDWWDAVRSTVRNCIDGTGRKNSIRAISVSAQGGTMVPVDCNGYPVSKAATWMDRRGKKQADELLALKDEAFFYNKTGWKLCGQLNLIQIIWLRENAPELFQKTHKFISTLEYINWKLAGVYATDATNAGITQLFDISEKKWDKEMLDMAGIDGSRLGTVTEAGEIIGIIRPEAANDLGLDKKVAVINGGHDQYCTALGAGVFNEGDMMISTGTAWVLLGIFDRPVFDKEMFFAPGSHVVPEKWGLLGSLPAAGRSMEWYKMNLGAMRYKDGKEIEAEDLSEVDRMASKKSPGADGVMFFPHFSGAFNSTLDLSGKASVLGLGLDHDRYDIARAVMEGVVYDINWMLEKFFSGKSGMRCLKVLGGAVRSGLWMKILADVTGICVLIPETANTACAGAAVLAGYGAGMFSIEEGYERFAGRQQEIASDERSHRIYAELYERYKERSEIIMQCYQ